MLVMTLYQIYYYYYYYYLGQKINVVVVNSVTLLYTRFITPVSFKYRSTAVLSKLKSRIPAGARNSSIFTYINIRLIHSILEGHTNLSSPSQTEMQILTS